MWSIDYYDNNNHHHVSNNIFYRNDRNYLHKGNNKITQFYKGKVKTHKYINRQISQQPENCENRNDPDLVQTISKEMVG